LNLQPNLLKHYLISLFLSSLRSQIPEPLQKGYLLTKLDLDNPSAGQGRVHREDMGMANKHVGYTYLVDQNGKIRWAGGGFAEKGEREALLACTGVLLGRGSGA
jgi:ATPase complex subunit ATP10